ncbi:MAG: restriction endonuclease subunit S [Chitinophagaceae bacterium]|nr:restriction endonuclease subunit S [Chitinophagaceae bacterium]MCZ2396291.1 restriction endonuclease subunit S [Chitinophagales bacterium]
MNVNKQKNNLVRLGDYIEVYDVKNVGSKNLPFYGINKDKTFMPTVADTNELDSSKYKIVEKDVFVFSGMQTGRDVCIRLALYEKDEPILVSPAYTTFIIKDKSEILPQYLFIQFNRFQMDRYGWFVSDGSIRSNLDWNVFCDIQIPLPSIETQRELVATYNGLKALAEQNEALIQPLTEACQAYIVDCKKKYPEVELGEYIEFYYEKNKDCQITLEQGINIEKIFINPHRPNSDLSSRIIVRKGQFAYCTQLNNENVAIAYRTEEDCVVSPVYKAFEIKQQHKNILLPEYLFLWLKRKEFGRYVYWRSVGSAYEFLQEENIREYKIPIPPIPVQQAIVNLYNCAEEAKNIANEAREKMKTLCPALVQKALHS